MRLQADGVIPVPLETWKKRYQWWFQIDLTKLYVDIIVFFCGPIYNYMMLKEGEQYKSFFFFKFKTIYLINCYEKIRKS